jgi:hypothetical protein
MGSEDLKARGPSVKEVKEALLVRSTDIKSVESWPWSTQTVRGRISAVSIPLIETSGRKSHFIHGSRVSG